MINNRFYSDDSSLIHGSLSKPGDVTDPVCGQVDINSKIMSLNFKDCHAKIRQVDSLETVGKGVVVQVTGELSNNGQPMRRFFQTFVLAPRSPTNYYVRNDIFRYQDEVFNDDEDYAESEKIEATIVDPVVEKSPILPTPIVKEEIPTTITRDSNLNEQIAVTNGNGPLSEPEHPKLLDNEVDGACLSTNPKAPEPGEDKERPRSQGEIKRDILKFLKLPFMMAFKTCPFRR